MALSPQSLAALPHICTVSDASQFSGKVNSLDGSDLIY